MALHSYKILDIWQLIVLGTAETSMCLSGGRFDVQFQYCPYIVRIWTCDWNKMLVRCIFHVILLILIGCNTPQPWENTLFLRSFLSCIGWVWEANTIQKYFVKCVQKEYGQTSEPGYYGHHLSFLYQLMNSRNHHLCCVYIRRNLTGRI